jgi:trans-2,3-dihydro-3-hydroxyanthranilate isomerase
MENRSFYILDVFASEKYAGNQLAVVRNAAGLSDKEMLSITRETKFSEATFIDSDAERNGGYDVRIFTPATEVPFAGHPTIGTAYIIQREIIKKPVPKLALNLKVGQIPVTVTYKDGEADVLSMKQLNPTFGKVWDAGIIARILNIDKSDIDTRFPIQSVSTGLGTIIVPLTTLAAVKKAKCNVPEFFKLYPSIEQAELIDLFSPETYHNENQLNVRVFCDCHGTPEDPATGSGNGCLAGWLVKYKYFGKDSIDIRIEQGYEIGRPSLLFLKAAAEGDKIDVNVGGRAIMLVRGELVG